MEKYRGIISEFTKYVGLNVLGMIGLSCYILADTFFVSKALGAGGLASLNLALPVYSAVSATGLMLGIGGGTRFSIFRFQGHGDEGTRVFVHTLLLGLSAGLAFLAAGLLAAPAIAGALGADGDTLGMTSIYLRVVLCFSPCFIMNNILLSFVRNDNGPNTSMAAMLTGSMANILLDYLFMFPLSMGMFGAALATGLAPVISMCVLSVHVLGKRNTLNRCDALSRCGNFSQRNTPIIRRYTFHWSDAAAILSPGLSSFITELCSGVVLVVFNLVILGLAGNTGVAAYGIVANLALVVTAVFTGIAQGIQPLVSRGYGAGDRNMLKAVIGCAMVLSLVLASGIYMGINACSGAVISVFNSQGSAILAAMAGKGIRLYFAGFFFAGINIVVAAFLSAVMDTAKAFAISIIRGCLAIIPLALLLPKMWGMAGVWLAFVLAELAAFAVSAAGIRGVWRNE